MSHAVPCPGGTCKGSECGPYHLRRSQRRGQWGERVTNLSFTVINAPSAPIHIACREYGTCLVRGKHGFLHAFSELVFIGGREKLTHLTVEVVRSFSVIKYLWNSPFPCTMPRE